MTKSPTSGDVSEKNRARAVLVAVYSGIVILSTTLFMNGILYVAVLVRYPGNETKTSIIGSLNSGLMCILSPVVSIVMDLHSCRVAIVTGGFLVSLSFFLSAFVNDLDLLIFTYGLMAGIGNAFASTPYIVVLGYYFQERRNLVIALSVAVIGVGMFISAPLSLFLLDKYGLQGTFLIISGLTAHVCVVGVICKPSATELRLHRVRSERRTKLKQHINYTGSSKSKLSRLLGRLSDVFDNVLNRNIITNVPFLLFLTSTATWNLMLGICLLHLPNYLTLIGADDVKITVIMTSFSIASTAGRFLSSFSVNIKKISSLSLHIVTLACCGVVTVGFPFYGRLAGADVVFACLVGICTGAPNSVMTPITLDMVGLELLSAGHGIENMFAGIGLLLGPPTAGMLLSYTGTYAVSFIFGGTIILLGSFLGLMSACLLRKGRRTTTLKLELVTTNTPEHILDEVRYCPTETNEQGADSRDVKRISVLSDFEETPCISPGETTEA